MVAETNKPDFSHPFASTGTIVAPSDSKLDTGWTAEVPPYQWENYLQNRQDNALVHLFQKGISVWDAASNYYFTTNGERSYVQGSDGNIYVAVQDSVGQNPVTDATDTYWTPVFDGDHSITFTTPGVTNWTVPPILRLGIKKATVIVTGAGGAGSRINATAGGGGAAGTTGIKIVDLTGVTTVSVTIGAGGTVAAAGVTAGAGGSSSFGAYVTAPGGGGGSGGGQGANKSAAAVGADISLPGTGGAAASLGANGAGYFAAGTGGASYWGGAGRGASNNVAAAGEDGSNGSGGSGSVLSALAGAGGAGIVNISWS